MSNVTRIRHALAVSAEIDRELSRFEHALIAAINDAKDAGLPQGFLVSILHAHTTLQTQELTK